MDNIKNHIDKNTVNQKYYFSNGSNTNYPNNYSIKNAIEEFSFDNLNENNPIINFNFLINSILSKINESENNNNSYIELMV